MGMTEKLDLCQEARCNAIWFMPIIASPSYHQYDVTDYQRDFISDLLALWRTSKNLWRKHISEISDCDLIWSSIHSGSWFILVWGSSKGRDSLPDYYVWRIRTQFGRIVYQQKSNYGWIVGLYPPMAWIPGNGEDFLLRVFHRRDARFEFWNKKVREKSYDIGKFCWKKSEARWLSV